MAKIIKQHRYYGGSELDDYEESRQGLITGSAFNYNKNKNSKILALGIQTVPGMKFYLNGNDYPIYVGPSGIYEIDYSDNCEIKSLRFDDYALKDLIDDEKGNYLIIDIMYDNGG